MSNKFKRYESLPLSEKFRDREGKKLNTEDFYLGYKSGIYRVVEVGESISLVKKVKSGKGVTILKPKAGYMGNSWLHPVKKEY